MNWEHLTRDIVVAAKISFSDLINRHREEKFYAFALFTDNDCYTISPTANTIEEYSKIISRKNITNQKSMMGYKWYIGDWVLDGGDDGKFDEISDRLSSASQTASETDSFLDFKEHVHSCMIEALSILDKEGFFGEIRGDIVLFISSSEYDESEEMENSSAKILNPPEIYERFLKRYDV